MKVPRSFVITSECIYLVEEDYVKFPALAFDNAKMHISPQYILRESHNINEVVSLVSFILSHFNKRHLMMQME